jgi:hypothetical protein
MLLRKAQQKRKNKTEFEMKFGEASERASEEKNLL